MSSERKRNGTTWKTIRVVAPYLWPVGSIEIRTRLLGSAFFLLLGKAALIVTPFMFKQLVDSLSTPQNIATNLSMGLVVGYALLRISSAIFGELRDAVFEGVAQRAIRSIALRAFRHLHEMSLSFHLDRKTGGISRTIERGTAGIRTILTYLVFNIVPTIVEVVLVCVILWTLLSFKFVMVAFVSVVAYGVFTALATEARLKHKKRALQINQDAHVHAVDSLLNHETVKQFSAEDFEANRFDKSLESFELASLDGQKSTAMLRIGQSTIVGASLAVLVSMAGGGVADNTMTLGDFVMVNTYMLQLFIPLDSLGFVYRTIKESTIDVDAMVSLLATEPSVRDLPTARPLSRGPGEIQFDRVQFTYDERRLFFEDLTFTVPAGKCFAFVGPSGAGKSTIVRLLLRFYDVKTGSIRVDGEAISAVTQQSLRAAIGIIPQDTVLFNESIYYNIAYGRPSATSAEVEEAAMLARIHETIMRFPDGYSTRVGERGLKLSGGERQRIAIARAIIKRPNILVFDEATSALDSRTERDIMVALREVSRDRTTLMIAHRLSTIVHADQIVFVDHGRIIERGRHDELLLLDGRYAAMWKHQATAPKRLLHDAQ